MRDSLIRLGTMLIATVICVALAGMALSVFLQVVMRYAFQAPPFWTEELARYLLIWLTFIGAAAAHQARDHIRVEWLPGMMEGRWRAMINALISMITVAVLIVILRAGIDIVQISAQRSPALGLSMRFVYAALPVGAVLMIVITLAQLWREIVTSFKGATPNVD